MKKICLDFVELYRREPLLMLLLTWVFLIGSTLSVYSTLLLVLLAFNRRNILKGADGFLLLIAIFSTIYSLFTYMNGYYDGAKGDAIFQALLPPTFYLWGKWMAKSSTMNHLFLFLIVFVGYIAIPVIIDVINDIKANQFINVLRDIERADGSKSGSATYLGMRVSLAVASLGILFSKANNSSERLYVILFGIIGALGATCVLHLVNRTGLVLGAISILSVFLLNLKYLSKKTVIIMLASISLLACFYIPQLEFVDMANEAYLDRSENVGTGGGRTELWEYGIRCLSESPWGVPSDERYKYAHNWWLDTTICGGVFSLFLLLVITIKHMKNSIIVIKKTEAGLLRSLIISINVAFFLTAFVEPIMEGYQFYVFLFFMFAGIVQQKKENLHLKCETRNCW